MLKKGTISKVREYYLEYYKKEDIFLNALKEFFDRPDLGSGSSLKTAPEEENLFTEWLFYDYKLKNGRTMLEDFILTNPFNLKKEELAVYKNLQKSVYGFFQVKNVDLGKGLLLKNLQNGKEYFVNEFQGTFNMEREGIITGRISKVANHYELVGSNPLVLPFQFSDEFSKFFRTKDRLSPKIIWEIMFKNHKKRMSKEEILKERQEIEKSIVKLLERTESDFTLQDVKNVIYNEEEQDDMMRIVAMFDRGRPDELSEVLELVTDAWNYFPHKSLNGLSPMEKSEIDKIN